MKKNIVLLLLIAMACNNEEHEKKPMIISFTANPDSITNGQSATLLWDVKYAETIIIDNNIGAVTETFKSVSPTATTTYKLKASNTVGTDSAKITIVVITSPDFNKSISQKYPNDLNIENDPDVFFTEMAEESDLSNLLANWSGSSGCPIPSISLDNTTTVPGSIGKQSIRLFTTGGNPGPDVCRTSYLRKTFPAFNSDTIYARWYVKYNTIGTFHHSGPRLGANNPITNIPPNNAGILPNGSDFFYIGAETTQGKKTPVNQSTFDFYNYWMHQRHNSFFPDSLYYGNSFINNPNVFIDMNKWNCIEVRLIMNNPVTAYNGEIAMWINGMIVSDVKTGTIGTWNEDNFIPGNGSPFEGFQFRNNNSLKFNYFELIHFVDQDGAGFINSINYDHIVLAKKYIGPITK